MSDHSPPLVAASTSSISEVDVNQPEGASQHLSMTLPTQPVADLGNKILFKKTNTNLLSKSALLQKSKYSSVFCLMQIVPISPRQRRQTCQTWFPPMTLARALCLPITALALVIRVAWISSSTSIYVVRLCSLE